MRNSETAHVVRMGRETENRRELRGRSIQKRARKMNTEIGHAFIEINSVSDPLWYENQSAWAERQQVNANIATTATIGE